MLTDTIINFLSALPPLLVIAIISMIPFIELRGSIPVGYFVYGMKYNADPLLLFFTAVIFNLIPVPLILKFLAPVETYLRRFKFWDRLMTKLFDKTRDKANEKVRKYEELALLIFVAIPLPGTGAWTGSLIAYLFGMDFKKSLFVIASGVFIAGMLVLTLCITGSNLVAK